MTLYIRNMVCNRCITAVSNALQALGYTVTDIKLGEATITATTLSKEATATINTTLEQLGFALIDNRKTKLIEQVKTLIIELVHYTPEQPNIKLSDYISQHLHHDYSAISKLFSDVEGVTLEQYVILQKIERVKELLVYGELSLSEIAWQLGYSSTAHLSAQFKKVTGLTPTHFRKVKDAKRQALDKVGQ